MGPLDEDLQFFKTAIAEAPATEGFMNAASPGVIALFRPNEYYASDEACLEVLAETMRHEYEAVVAAGFILQLDSRDLGLGRHMMFKNEDDDAYESLTFSHVDALNYATRKIPAEKMRLHVCRGNYEGQHHCDAPMERDMAGTDCGFSTFAGFGAIDEDIVYAKLKALCKGAALASEQLWSRASHR